MTYAIEAEGLTKRFGTTQALAGIDLFAREGSVHAVLGPNGAGKTTAVRILATLLKADTGAARVGGYDVARDARKVREIIGLTGQYASVDEDLTGMQNLVLIGQLLDLSKAAARARAIELLEWFDLSDAGARMAKTYSGGMRRRLDLAASLVGRPSVISWTSRRQVSIPRSARTCGTSFATSSTTARPCCSRPNTSTRPTLLPTRSASSTTAG